MQQIIEQLGLTTKSRFIPYSQSRNAGGAQPSLNWEVTVLKDGKPIATVDYMAGLGHCPSYKYPLTVAKLQAVDRQCETGTYRGRKINPDAVDVLASLAMEADVIDYASFEDWAESFGYDPDSREAEKVYNACMDTALKLRSALGDDGLNQLKEAANDH